VGKRDFEDSVPPSPCPLPEDTPKREFGFGALPPPGMAWQMGKTAASILFVNAAESAIGWLQSQIEAVKKGEVVLYEEVRVDPPLVYGWERALEEPSPIERAVDSFSMNHTDGNMWGCGIGLEDGEEVIEAYLIDGSKSDLPSEDEGFKVIVIECDRPVPH